VEEVSEAAQVPDEPMAVDPTPETDEGQGEGEGEAKTEA
jgi:hypothetical protein